jgi:putative membrane protein
MSPTLRSLGSIAITCLALVACDRPEDQPHSSSSTAAGPGVTPAPERREPEMPTAPRRTASFLDDSQSVEALGTINHEEIELAQYALTRAHADQARQLAQMMIDQHTQAESDIVAWAQAHSVVGRMEDVSQTVRQSAATVRARLESASDADFDRAYVQSQIEMHTDALDVLDRRIVPGATDPDFRTLVQNIRTGVATHLAHARSALAQLPRTSGEVAAQEPQR